MSTDIELEFVTRINPLSNDYTYGLWISVDGDNYKKGYGNKMFNDAGVANFGHTIVLDELKKG